MEVSSRIQDLMSFVLALGINSQPSTLHNQMVLLKGRIEPWLTWQDQYWMSTMWVILFEPKLSTWLATIESISIVILWWRRLCMSSWMEESPILHTFGFLVVNATYWRNALDWAHLKRNMMKVSCLVTPLLAKLIEFRIWLVLLLKRCMMLSLMKLMVLKSVDIWERNKELIRKRTDIGEHFTRKIIQSIVFIFYH